MIVAEVERQGRARAIIERVNECCTDVRDNHSLQVRRLRLQRVSVSICGGHANSVRPTIAEAPVFRAAVRQDRAPWVTLARGAAESGRGRAPRSQRFFSTAITGTRFAISAITRT